MLQAFNPLANLFNPEACIDLTARSNEQVQKRQLLFHIMFISSDLMSHASDVQAVLCLTSNSSSSGFQKAPTLS